MKPVYSICMCNYNMADTLERSLGTILEQIDERFELLVVDDGSSDNSLEILDKLREKYPALRVHALPRDKKRKLGFTRNISVQEARGDYVLLHLDCDDVFEPFLIDFTIVFHQIEACYGRDILLSGHHINMARRSFLLEHGPYRNIFRGEDRDLWSRLAETDSYILLDHVNFVTRLPKPIKKQYGRTLAYTWDHIVNDFRAGKGFFMYLNNEIKRRGEFTFKFHLYRLLILIPAFITSKFMSPLTLPDMIDTPEKVIAYRKRMQGRFAEIMDRAGCKADFSKLRSEDAQRIFV